MIQSSGEPAGIGEFLRRSKFLVPANQRSYSWKPPEIDELFDDLTSYLDTGDYFLGWIVLSAENEGDPPTIIDGQQRLATFCMIYAAIRDYLCQNGKHDVARKSLQLCCFARGPGGLSHWILDFIAHPRDLAIYDDKWKVGLGLWNYRGLEFGLEVALLAGGIVLYLARNAISAARKKAVIGFGLALIIIQIGDTFVPRAPLSDRATAMGVWIFYTLFVGVAFLLEKRSELDSSKHRQGDGVRN